MPEKARKFKSVDKLLFESMEAQGVACRRMREAAEAPRTTAAEAEILEATLTRAQAVHRELTRLPGDFQISLDER